MAQQLLTLPTVDPTVENWDALLQAAIASLKAAIHTFGISVDQGDTVNPSIVTIQLQDAEGVAQNLDFIVRVRLTDANGYAAATHAAYTVTTGSVKESITGSKDAVLAGTGTIVLSIIDATAEAFEVHLGPPTLLQDLSDYNVSETITHVNSKLIHNIALQQIVNSLGADVSHP